MLRPALAVLLLTAVSSGQELVLDVPLEVELGPGAARLEDGGPARTFDCAVTFAGKLYVWATSPDLDPRLSIADAAGRSLGMDDDSGGGTSACLVLDVVPGERLVVTAGAADAGATGTFVLQASAAPETDATLAAAEAAREAVGRIEAARRAGDASGAREIAADAVEALLAAEGGKQSPSLAQAAAELGDAAYELADPTSAQRAWQRALEFRSRVLPGDHPDLQAARAILAVVTEVLGGLAEARTLKEQVLEVYARTLPDEHPSLQAARMSLGVNLKAQGELAGAHALFEQVLEVRARTLPADHVDLQRVRMNLAITLHALGELETARELQEQVLEVFARTLPDDHPDLQKVRLNLAFTVKALGDFETARALEEQVLEIRSHTLPADHPDVMRARLNLAATLQELGELTQARSLFEQALEGFSRTLPADHPEVQRARGGLAGTLEAQGDLAGARALLEEVLASFTRTLPAEHPDLQLARAHLANAIMEQGDLAGARALFEQVLEVRARTLPADHPHLQLAKLNVASLLRLQGDPAGARALLEEVIEVFSRTLPEDHPHLEVARSNLAATLAALGDLTEARALLVQVLGVLARTLPADNPRLQAARLNLAAVTEDELEARALCAEALDALSGTVPDDHPYVQGARGGLAGAVARASAREGGGARLPEERGEFERLTRAFTEGLRRSVSTAIADASSREAEERILTRQSDLALALSLASGLGVFEGDRGWQEAAFVASETARGAALASARIARGARSDPGYDELRARLRAASAELAGLAQAGAGAGELVRARAAVDAADRELVRRAGELSPAAGRSLAADFEALAAAVPEGAALIGYRNYLRTEIASGEPPVESAVESLCAFVVRSDRPLARIELGPLEPIEGAAARWRASLGTDAGRGIGVVSRPALDDAAAGAELRALVLDPLRAALDGVERVVLAPDGVLHAVPLDALPAGEPWTGAIAADAPLMGDRLEIEVRSSLLELLVDDPPLGASAGLLALGGADFGGLADGEEAPAARAIEASGVLRGSSWEAGFGELPGTAEEVLGIARHFAECFGEQATSAVLLGEQATRENLFQVAPTARFVHVATHGWFAPESIRSLEDPELGEGHAGPGALLGEEQHARGMSPMLLCGLALAGANRPAGPTGSIPGLVTAEELAALDLSGCELAVLSACDTNVGVRRAGQGVASLQRALHMAGARTVITSLWNVPDQATVELMVDFYRRIWIERQPKARALWAAKRTLRDARDENGAPRYAVRDWAAWVLTGEPD